MSKDLFEIEGFQELERKIKQLGNDKDKKKEILVILRKKARPVVRAIKQETPVSKKPHYARGKLISPGNLKRSIGNITGKKGRSRINPTIYVGPRTRGVNDGWYGHFVHDGVNVYNEGFKPGKKAGDAARALSVRGAVSHTTQGNPFQERGWRKVKSGVIKDTERSMQRFIQKRIDRLSK
jgi:hypothetical protein